MVTLDPILLARIQFAFTVSFHIVFPATSIALASFLSVVEGCWLKTQRPVFKEVYRFWVKIFAVTFGLGVVSGVVMSYEFGTNWSVFSDRVGNVLGPLFGYEVLTAFFLEASFLGIMLFGWGRVSERMHFVATCVVAFGTLISAFWILAANSWMQTPLGFIVGPDGRLSATSWFDVIFNPSFPFRFAHMVTAAYLSVSFVVGGVGAFYLFKQRHIEHARVMLGMATLMAALVAPLQILIGDLHGLNTFEHQPAKIAAIEGAWDTKRGADLYLFGWPDAAREETLYPIVIPKMSSLILTHSWDGEVKGLKNWAPEDRPPVLPVFFAFRIMVLLGVLMATLGVVSAIQYWRGRLFHSRLLHYAWMGMMPSGYIALLAGWFVTEIGRQPYSVYSVIRTVQAVSPALIGSQLAGSLLAFVLVYTFAFGVGSYYILRLIAKGIPEQKDSTDQYYGHGMESSVVSTVTHAE